MSGFIGDIASKIKNTAEEAGMTPLGSANIKLRTGDAAANNNDDNNNDGNKNDGNKNDGNKNDETRSPEKTDNGSTTTNTIVHNDVKTAVKNCEDAIRDSFNDLKKTEVAELIGSITEDFCKKIDNKETMEPFIEAILKKINEHFYSDEAEKKKFAIELLYGIVNNKTLDNKKDNKKDTTVGGASDADETTATDAVTATAIAVAKDTTANAETTATDAKTTATATNADADAAETTATATETTATATETTATDAKSDDDDDDDTVKNKIKDETPNAKIVLAFLKKEISSLFKGAKPIGDDGKTTPNDRVHHEMQKNIDYILYDTIIKKVEKHLKKMNNPREIFFGEDGIGKVISIEHNEQRLTDLKRILNVQLMCNKSIINLEQLKSMELDEYKENKDFEGFKEFIHAIQLPERSNDGEKTKIVKESDKETKNNEETKNSEETKIVKELLETLFELYVVAVHLHELNDKSGNNKNDYILERLNLKNVSDSEISGFLADVFKAIQDFFNINSEKPDNTDDGKTGENNPGNETPTGGSIRKKKMRKTKKIKSKSKRRTR